MLVDKVFGKKGRKKMLYTLEVHIGSQVFHRKLSCVSENIAIHWFEDACNKCTFEIRLWLDGKALIRRREATT